MNPSLNIPQAMFLAMPQKFRAMVCGFGTGKTWAGCSDLAKHMWEHPRINAGYFAPTIRDIRDIFYPTIDEVAFDWGMRSKVNTSNKEVHLFAGRVYRGTIICRSMDDPGSIVGFKVGRSIVDELDLFQSHKAEMAWRKIIARMRYKVDNLQNGVGVTTTPEGFKFVYKQFVKQVREKPELADLYGLMHASTYDNAKNLPDDYISSLRASYPPQLIEAYLRGRFVNLVSGSVYPNFDRRKNHTDDEIRPGEPLHVGMDFNVMNMTAVISVIRDGLPETVAELTSVRDTPTMARLLRERYRLNSSPHAVTVYPDVSGQNTSSKSASQSDFTILREAGLTINAGTLNADGRAHASPVKDRINSVNALILNDRDERRWKINTNNCPVTTEAFEQQAYDKNGEPDKKSGHDHATEATGYFLQRKYPIVKPAMSINLKASTNA